MREINTHKTNDCNTEINLHAADERGPGNANHLYVARYPGASCELSFQNGPIGEVGCNGITNEVLLAVLIDRMRGFQDGDYRCRENALALTKLEEALHWLHHRTRERETRGVEGTHSV